MYEMKTLLPQFHIKLPTCMYEMRNISLTMDAVSQSTDGNLPINNGLNVNITTDPEATSVTAKISTICPLDLEQLAQQIRRILKACNNQDVESVIKRQEKVLDRLNQLKNQLDKIRSTLDMSDDDQENNCRNENESKKVEVTLLNVQKQEAKPLDHIVVNANPNFIPYGLLALRNLWRDSYIIEFKIYQHSTITELNGAAKEFEEAALKSASNICHEDDVYKPKLCITLMWKECLYTEMINLGAICMPIYGEVNILRYMARIGPKSFHYDDCSDDTTLQCNEIDSILDMCYILLYSSNNNRIRSGLIQKLQRRLNNQEYFVGKTVTIADIAVYSSLKSIQEITDKQLPANLLNWRLRIQQMIMI